MMDSVDFEKLLDIIQKEDPVSFPILKIYYLVMKQLSDTENDDYYYEIRDLVSENLNTLEPDTGKRLLLNIMSICNMKSNSGKKEFIKESFKGHMENIHHLVNEGKLIVAGPFEKNDKNYRK